MVNYFDGMPFIFDEMGFGRYFNNMFRADGTPNVPMCLFSPE